MREEKLHGAADPNLNIRIMRSCYSCRIRCREENFEILACYVELKINMTKAVDIMLKGQPVDYVGNICYLDSLMKTIGGSDLNFKQANKATSVIGRL